MDDKGGAEPARTMLFSSAVNGPRGRVMVAVIASLAIAGCGGGAGQSSSKRSSTTTGKASGSHEPSLDHPLTARCSFPTFAKPKATPIPTQGNSGQAWQIAYLPLPLAPVRSGQTNNVTVIEESPALPDAKLREARVIVVSGRRVRLRAPTAKNMVYVATWKTARARYIMLANGRGTGTLKEFIACLP